MKATRVGIISVPAKGRLRRSVPRGPSCICDSSSSAASISAKMRRQRSRNEETPSAVSVDAAAQVSRWKRRAPSPAHSIRAIALPIADDDTPSCRPATVKLRASAARTKALSAPRLSIHRASLRTSKSDMIGTMAHVFCKSSRDHIFRSIGPHPEGLEFMSKSVVLITGALTGIGRVPPPARLRQERRKGGRFRSP